MDDLEKYIKKRKENNPCFAEGFEKGYMDFKIAILSQLVCGETSIPEEEPIPSCKAE